MVKRNSNTICRLILILLKCDFSKFQGNILYCILLYYRDARHISFNTMRGWHVSHVSLYIIIYVIIENQSWYYLLLTPKTSSNSSMARMAGTSLHISFVLWLPQRWTCPIVLCPLHLCSPWCPCMSPQRGYGSLWCR